MTQGTRFASGKKKQGKLPAILHGAKTYKASMAWFKAVHIYPETKGFVTAIQLSGLKIMKRKS